MSTSASFAHVESHIYNDHFIFYVESKQAAGSSAAAAASASASTSTNLGATGTTGTSLSQDGADDDTTANTPSCSVVGDHHIVLNHGEQNSINFHHNYTVQRLGTSIILELEEIIVNVGSV